MLISNNKINIIISILGLLLAFTSCTKVKVIDVDETNGDYYKRGVYKVEQHFKFHVKTKSVLYHNSQFISENGYDKSEIYFKANDISNSQTKLIKYYTGNWKEKYNLIKSIEYYDKDQKLLKRIDYFSSKFAENVGYDKIESEFFSHNKHTMKFCIIPSRIKDDQSIVSFVFYVSNSQLLKSKTYLKNGNVEVLTNKDKLKKIGKAFSIK